MPQRPFEPIYPNPYIAGNPIRSKEMFFGRVDEFRFIQRALEEGRKAALIVLYGERRSGKSSILYQILNGELGEAFLPFFVDMQIMAGISSDAEFFGRIIADCCKGLGKNSIPADRYPISSKNTNPTEVFRKFLEDLKTHFPQRALLFLIDEYEILETKITEDCLSPHVPTFFAGLLETALVSFVFTGSRKLEARDQTLWGAGLLQKAASRKISFLTEEDTARLVTQPLQNKVTFAPEVVAEIYTLTAGQPFYTQIICQNLVYHLNEVEKYRVEFVDLQAVVDNIIDNPPPQMIFNWGEHSAARKLILSLLAEFADAPNIFLSAGEIWRGISKNKLAIDVSKAQISSLLTELFQDDYVLQKDREYGFRLDLYRRWVRHDHNIWQVKKEIGPLELARITKETRKKVAKRKKRLTLLEHGLLIALGILVVYLGWRLIKPWIVEGGVTIQANGGPFLVVVDDDTVGTTRGEIDSNKYVYKEDLIKGEFHVFKAILLASGEMQSDTVKIGEDSGPVAFKFAEFPVTIVTDAASMIARLGGLEQRTKDRDAPWQQTFHVPKGKYPLTVSDLSTGEEKKGIVAVHENMKPIYIDFDSVVVLTLNANFPFSGRYEWRDSRGKKDGRKFDSGDSTSVIMRGNRKGMYEFMFTEYGTGQERRLNRYRIAIDTTVSIKFESKPPVKPSTVTERAIPNVTPTCLLQIYTTPDGAKVILDGEQKEKPTPFAGNLSRGDYVIELIKTGYDPIRMQITLYQDTTIDTSLTAQYGSLVVKVNDEQGAGLYNAKVYVDDKPQGVPGQQIKLLVGNYRIRVECSGYITEVKDCFIKKNDDQTLSFILKKL